MMEEDAISSLSVRVKIHMTVWDFILPETPSLPAVFGVSCVLIKKTFFLKLEICYLTSDVFSGSLLIQAEV